MKLSVLKPLLLVLPALYLFSGCAAKGVKAGAERVIVTKNAAPKECKFMCTVIGEQGGAFTGGWTSNKNLAVGAMNDMKNGAFDLGANFVSLEVNTAGATQSGSRWGMSGQQTDSTYTGNAYKCPPKSIGL